MKHCQNSGDCSDDDDKQLFCTYACVDYCTAHTCGAKRVWSECEAACASHMEGDHFIDYSECMEACGGPVPP